MLKTLRNFIAKPWWRDYLFLILATLMVFGPVFFVEINNVETTDFKLHTQWAKQILSAPQDLPVAVIAHAGWQWLVYITHAVVGYSWSFSTWVAALLCVIGFVGTLFGLLRKRLGALLSGALALGVLLAGPVALLLPFDRDFGGYVWANVYHNPTLTLLQPLALLQACFSIEALSGKKAGWARILITLLVSAAAVYAKPNFVICLLPALGLLALIRLIKKQPVDWTRLVVGVVLPSIALLIWQFYLTYTQNSDSSIILAPFEVMRSQSAYLLPKFLLSIAFPVVVTLTFWKKAVKDLRIQFGWLGFVIGAVFMYFFAESGPRLLAGNFIWCGQITILMLLVCCLLFLAEQKFSDVKPAARWLILAVGFLHLYFGITYLFSELFTIVIK